ncbi:MAG: aconitate hydratase [Alectoria fallacina]|uniref:Aconitate hydratase, mitochondrial n=1 Tax=Alectoria fallacina TaxID=1903189 RepID=A0A8H3F547_9LECA|nr:MAG: aconitate hydratase [Alectoria fallacina]
MHSLRARSRAVAPLKNVDVKCLRPNAALHLRFVATEAIPKTLASSDIPSRIPPYKGLFEKLKEVYKVLGKETQLTLTEKILYSHLDSVEESLLSYTQNGKEVRGNATLKLKPDRVAMQDASAQMALLQFMSCGLPSTAVPTSIHCDHMIVGERGADIDLPASITGNKEVFDFLESAAQKYGIEFWPPGAGIIHQTVLENYAAPGLMMLGTDSHTPNAGGLGAIAIGVGGADAVDAMVDAPWELKAPRILGVKLEGHLSGWAAPKDVIMKLAGLLTVRGGTGFVIEYFGAGVDTISCTGMATIANMGAEVGATTSIFPFTQSMGPYLRSTHRIPLLRKASNYAGNNRDKAIQLLRADPEVIYDEVVSIDLSSLEPHINGPFTPDLSTPLSQFKDAVKTNEWPESFGAGLIGSCTNSSYEDMTRSEDLVKQASAAGLKPKADFFITPGSEQIRATLARDSTLETFSSAGGTVLANACGPCIGQWKRTDGVSKGETNAIFSSYNRNFKGRNDGNPSTMNFLASPEIVTAMSYAGSTTFNPLTDTLPTPSGNPFQFSPPSGLDLPFAGFAQGNLEFTPTPGVPSPDHAVIISPTSDRLAVLESFAPFPTGELEGLRVLYKIKGQCTTDTISAAGPWLKYKGHLPNISANTLIGAVNAETGETNVAYDHFDLAESSEPPKSGIPQLAEKWKRQGKEWMVVAESNYGEGSAREHAALQPRYLGGRVILAKSFARIHETNLKKQGIVPLVFESEGDYERIRAGDVVSTLGLYEMLQNGGRGEVSLKIEKREGEEILKVRHTISKGQAGFILAGSALNLLAKQEGAEE